MEKIVRVISYSGYRLNERPIKVFVNNTKLEVKRIIKRWRDEEYDCFKLLADDNNVYQLRWHRIKDIWMLQKEI